MNRFARSLFLKKSEWLTRQVFLLIITLVIFVLAMVWSEPIPRAAAMQINQQTLQQDLQIISDKVHFIPGSEIENSLNFNTKQTNGVILGAAILLLIILIGVTTGSQQTSTD